MRFNWVGSVGFPAFVKDAEKRAGKDTRPLNTFCKKVIVKQAIMAHSVVIPHKFQ
jgi:hypothetical protein